MSHEDSQMMKILETIADRLVDMHLSNNRRFDELAAQIESRLPAKAGEQLSLLAIVTAPEPKVVPNEDEAMPVLAECLCCEDKEATTSEQVEKLFGYQKMEDGTVRVQKWCRECRGLYGKDKTEPVVEPTIVQDKPAPHKKRRLPDPIRVIGQQFRDLHEKADAKAEERAKVLAASKGRETAESVDLLVQEQDLRTKAREFQKQYDKDRRPFANPRKPKAAK